MKKTRGKLITFEGIDYSGKTTQAKKLFNYLRGKGYKVIFLREPGGENISERIRKVLLSSKNIGMCPITELFLYMAARGQLVSKVILPALRQNKIVICDRFYDSSLAYQGHGRGLDKEMINYLNRASVYGLKPDLTVLIDIPLNVFIKRMGKNSRKKDRIERGKIDFYKKVKEGYLKIAREDSRRFKVIEGSGNIDKVWLEIKNIINRFLE